MNTLKLTATSNGELTDAAPAAHVELTASSELMRNQIAAQSIDPQHMMKTVQDSLGDPMMFSIGNDNVLYVILRNTKSKTGWQQYDLSSAIGPDLEATDFEVAQGPNGRLLLALAMSPKGNRDVSTLYLTPLITNDTTLTDWSIVGKQWVARPFNAKDAVISGIWIGACDGQSSLGIAAVATAGTVDHYVFNTDAGDDTWSWKKFPTPENATTIRDIAIGKVNGDPGVYALYDTSAGQTLEFTSLPDPIYHKSSYYQFPLATNTTAIAALPGKGISDDLYAAGDGIFVYPSSSSQRATIADQSLVSGVHELLVNQDDASVCIFVVCGDEVLMHTEGLKSDIGQWSQPIAIRSGVTQIAALRNPYKLTNELMVVTGDSKLTYFYQDPKSTIWKETTIDLPAIDKIVEFNTYTTHLALHDASGKPMINQKLKLTASSWTYVTINGQSHSLDLDNPVTVTSDYSGNLTIINRVSDISAPIYHIQSELFPEVIDVNPAAKVKEGLKKIQSGSDWTKIIMKDGKPLLTETHSDATLSSAAEAVKQLTQLADTKPAGSAHRNAQLHHTAIMRPIGAASHAYVNASALPANYGWGMSFHSTGATYWKEGDAHATMSASSVIDAIELFVGDALNWLEEKFHEIGNFFTRLANGVVEFCIELGTKVYKFIINTVETSFRVINWVLKKSLGIDLEKLVKWVGFIFDWEDIKRVHRTLVHMTNESIKYGTAKIHQVEGTVNAFFDDLKKKAKELAPFADGDQTVQSQQRNVQEQQSDQTKDLWKEVHLSPGGNWGQHHLMHSGAVEAAGGDHTVSDPFHALMNDIIRPTLQSVEESARQLVEDFKQLFDNHTLTLNQAIQKVTSDVAIGFIDALQKIVVGAIKFVEDLIKYVQAGLNTKIEIPFFSAFYRQLAGSDLSVLDAVMLITAIPTTIAYKLVSGKTPFPEEHNVFETGGQEQIFGLLSGEKHVNPKPNPKPLLRASRPLMMAAAAAGDPQGDKENDNKEDTTSTGWKIYSQVGGFAYLIASIVNDTLGLVAGFIEADAITKELDETSSLLDKKKTDEKLHSYEKWRLGFALAQIPFSFPVGTHEEVALQRGIWGFSIASPIIEFGLSKVSNKAKGAWNILEGIGVFIVEAIIFSKELHNLDPKKGGNDQADVSLKLTQNIFYLLSKGFGGAANILSLERGIPDPNPYRKAAQVGCLVGSGATSLFAAIFSFVRIVTNIGNELEHQNF